MASLALGIDVGTSATKGVLADAEGQIVASARVEHAFDQPRPGFAEHDAEKVWWDDTVQVITELIGDRPGEPAAVCVSGVGPCALIADADGAPLHPAVLYGIDSRAGQEIDEINAELGEREIIARSGSPLTSQAAGPKLRWLGKQDPSRLAADRRMLMPSSFAVLRLTGEYVLDHHSASQCDPLYDLSECRWIDEWWEPVAGALPQPRLLWPGDVAGEVSAAASEATGIPAGTPVCAGTIDAWAESIAAGVARPGQLMVMYGSTVFLVQCMPSPASSPLLWATAGVNPGTFSLAAGMATGGLAVNWVRDLVGQPDWDDLLRPAASVPAGSRGLVVLPYLAGERTPIFDPDARGLLLGLTLRHGPPEVARAVIEGIAFAIRHNIETMAEVGSDCTEIVGVGGGTRDSLLPQLVTDVLGREQAMCDPVVGASFGSAMLAARAATLTTDPGSWVRYDRVLQPRAASSETYAALYKHYVDLYPKLAGDMHALARVETSAD
jgi:xylulokinase